MLRLLLSSALALSMALPAVAADPVQSRLENFKRQTSVLDARADRYQSKKYAPKVTESIPGYTSRHRSQYEGAARAAARRHGVPEDLFLRLVTQESGWNPRAKSHKGAIGLAQLMPQTARLLRVDPNDPHQNLDGGARYLAEQYRTFGSWRLALAAYNAGPAAVEKYDGIPPYRETRGYVRAIMGS